MARTEQVFTPGRNTTLTYVERVQPPSNTPKPDLATLIRRGGFIVSIIGPTKMGKTVLAQRAAPHAFTIHGNMVQEVDDFWERFANFLEIPTGTTKSVVTSDKAKWGFRSNFSFFGAAEVGANAGGEHGREKGSSTTSTIQADQAALKAVEEIRELGGKVTIVVDDFHFIPVTVRKSLVQALKPLAFAGATIILITLPHRRTETSDLVSDVGGRTATVEVNPWVASDLASIATLGFAELNLVDSSGLAHRLAEASYGSPQIMQQLCLELCETTNEIFETAPRPQPLKEPTDWPLFFRHIKDEASIKWVERLLTGPPVRGRDRTHHTLTDGRELDGYQVIIAALKELGPPLDLSLARLSAQVSRMLKHSSVRSINIATKLTQMTRIARKPLSAELPVIEDEDLLGPEEEGDLDPAAGTPQPVFEYTPDVVGNSIHIIEPYLAYTIRWYSEDLLSKAVEQEEG